MPADENDPWCDCEGVAVGVKVGAIRPRLVNDPSLGCWPPEPPAPAPAPPRTGLGGSMVRAGLKL